MRKWHGDVPPFKGSHIACQVWAHGRSVPDDWCAQHNYTPISASDISLSGNKFSPLPLTHDDIKTYIAAYVQTAVNLLEKAGFDAVELHFANGYLPDQFLQDVSNKRTDEYGDGVENKATFPLEILDAVVKRVGEKKVGLRLSPWSPFQDKSAAQQCSDCLALTVYTRIILVDMGMQDSKPTFTYFVSEIFSKRLSRSPIHPHYRASHLW